MTTAHLLIVLAVAAATIAATAAARRVGIATPVVLVVAGLVIGFLPFVPDVTLSSRVVLDGFLPILVFEAAFTSSPRAFRREAGAIGLLAVVVVVLTAAGVAAVAHAVVGLPWAMAVVLGTAVGPTDAAAASSIAGRLNLPRRLTAVIQGEALFNDVTALVLYAAAVTWATTGSVSVGGAALRIVYGAVVGAGVGLAVGVVGRLARGVLDDPPVEIVTSLLLAFAAYLPAEALGASGVLAAVTAGLYLGWFSPGVASASGRLQSRAFWETLVFLVDASLFVLVGLSFHAFTASATGPAGRLAVGGVAVVATVLAIRMAWMMFLPAVVGRLGGRPPRPLGERVVLGWAGMRGAVTLAAVLAVPVAAGDGRTLAGRDTVVYLAFAVILATLVGQGLTLPPVVRRLVAAEPDVAVSAEAAARRRLAEAALDHIRARRDDGEITEEEAARLSARFEERVARLARLDPVDTEAVARERRLGAEVLAVQRKLLLALRRDRDIGDATLRRIQRDLDLEETRTGLRGSRR